MISSMMVSPLVDPIPLLVLHTVALQAVYRANTGKG